MHIARAEECQKLTWGHKIHTPNFSIHQRKWAIDVLHVRNLAEGRMVNAFTCESLEHISERPNAIR